MVLIGEPIMFNLRYSRQMALKELSVEGYEKISSSRVCVVGVGATGSPAADLFVRAGVKDLRIIDPDIVDISNIHRQILFTENDVGQKKVEVARKRLEAVNSRCKVDDRDVLLREENIAELLSDCHIIIDGTDNMETRRLINRYCVKNRIPWIFAASIGTVGQAKAIIPGETSCLDCFVDNDASYSMSCEETGVLASSPIMVSSMVWTLAVRILTGQKEKGELFYIDPWNHEWQKIQINRNPECATCGGL